MLVKGGIVAHLFSQERVLLRWDDSPPRPRSWFQRLFEEQPARKPKRLTTTRTQGRSLFSVSPDGRYLLDSGSGTLDLLDARSLLVVQTVAFATVRSLEVHFAGDELAVLYEGEWLSFRWRELFDVPGAVS
jgi:hypothetical protein